MQRNTLRHLAPLLVLAVAAAGTWAWNAPSVATRQARAPSGEHMHYVDVADWYSSSADEAAVLSPYDLRMEDLSDSLPRALGQWVGTDLGEDPEITTWYDDPDVVIRRRYVESRGRAIWVTVIGSSGAKSYRLFEHTPSICYVSQGWLAIGEGVRRVSLTEGSVPVRRGVYEDGDAVFLVYDWYLWDSPSRDAAQGITSWRLATEAGADPVAAEGRLNEFVRLLFSQSIQWHRF